MAFRCVAAWMACACLLAGCQSWRGGTYTLPEEMVLIPAGWFLMGQNEGAPSNQPQRLVYVDAFAIDQTEVTQAAFAPYAKLALQHPQDWYEEFYNEQHGSLPVTGVVWEEANSYCRRVGKRLPCEAEWEKAARGTDGRRYPWGETWQAGRANSQEELTGGALPVGSFPLGASPYGLHDMAGNAAEWVADTYDRDYYSYGPLFNPTGPEAVLDHVLRGGSWALPEKYGQTFLRDSSHSTTPNPGLGFRCALSIPGKFQYKTIRK